jgi:hypothetical protein
MLLTDISLLARAMAGSLPFISQATAYFARTMFPIRILVIALAVIDMRIFDFITVCGVRKRDLEPIPALPARLADGTSLACRVPGRRFWSLDRFHRNEVIEACSRIDRK